ncbi:Glycosyltransferase family 2 protein OS=Streptomyces alboniger OX=132473 GN=CP975_03665 PE=4 SV=1 [Streptomyces alboniger]
MRRVCLTLPTNRACPETIAAIGAEAAYATAHFDVEVHLLILDSSDPATFAAHAAAVRALPDNPRVGVHHLGEPEQRAFLSRVISRADVAKPELVLELMLPAAVSYGACTNRAFLLAAALGCESVHRRDSDSRYQVLDGEPVFPIHHELASLGRSAADAAHGAVETDLAPRHAHKRVAMVGGSFVGELSVDIGEIRGLDPQAYHDVVSLWAPDDWSEAQKRELVEDSFRGAGSEPFTGDRATLTLVDPMRVDMCNIAFHGVHERVPLPPATDTIGSDYFLIHLVHDAALPGVLHNRNIVNYYTAERRTDAGFIAYQTRFVKFFLSMLYFNFIYERMAEAGEALLDGDGRVRASAVSGFARESTALDTAGNVRRLDRIDAAYRRLGGRYAHFADLLADRRERFLEEARADIEDFALLTEAWEPLIRAAAATGAHLTSGRPA